MQIGTRAGVITVAQRNCSARIAIHHSFRQFDQSRLQFCDFIGGESIFDASGQSVQFSGAGRDPGFILSETRIRGTDQAGDEANDQAKSQGQELCRTRGQQGAS